MRSTEEEQGEERLSSGCGGGGEPDTLPAAGLLGELVCLDGGPPEVGLPVGEFCLPLTSQAWLAESPAKGSESSGCTLSALHGALRTFQTAS